MRQQAELVHEPACIQGFLLSNLSNIKFVYFLLDYFATFVDLSLYYY